MILFEICILLLDRKELEIKRDENTINDIAEKLEFISNTNMVTEWEIYTFLLKMEQKNKTITAAGETVIDYKKELDDANYQIKGYED